MTTRQSRVTKETIQSSFGRAGNHFEIETFGLALWGLRLKVTGKGQGCVAVRYLIPYFGYFIFPHVG